MATSQFLAGLIGPTMLIVALTMLFNRRTFNEVTRELLERKSLIFMAGILSLVAGLAIVNTHNVWTFNWPLIITIVGWLAVAGGIMRISMPDRLQDVARVMVDNAQAMTVLAGINAALGAWLTWAAYLS